MSCGYSSSICDPCRRSNSCQVGRFRGSQSFDGDYACYTGHIVGSQSGHSVSLEELGKTANVRTACITQAPPALCEIQPSDTYLVMPGTYSAALDGSIHVYGNNPCVGSSGGFGGYGNSGGYGSGGYSNLGCYDGCGGIKRYGCYSS